MDISGTGESSNRVDERGLLVPVRIWFVLLIVVLRVLIFALFPEAHKEKREAKEYKKRQQ